MQSLEEKHIFRLRGLPRSFLIDGYLDREYLPESESESESSLKLNTYTQWSVIRQKPGTGLVLGWFQGELSMIPGSGYPVNRCPPSEAGVNQLPRVLEHLLPFVYGIKDFLPGAQLQVDILKVLVRAKHQSF